MTTYITESGSVYEVDHDNKRVRRLSGVKDPTPRQGKDGEWKTYVELNTELFPGCLFFIWEHPGKGTRTSPVVGMNKDVQDN